MLILAVANRITSEILRTIGQKRCNSHAKVKKKALLVASSDEAIIL